MKHYLPYLIAAAFAFIGCVKVPEPAQPIPGAKADFTWEENKPFTVTFTNNSTAGLTPWLWEFGDGSSSGGSANKVTHTYSKAGTYNVTLTCKDTNRIPYTCTKTITVKGDGGSGGGDNPPAAETNAYIKGFTYYKLPRDEYHYKTKIEIPSLFQDVVTITSSDRYVKQSDLPLKLIFNTPKKVCKTADWIYCSAVMVTLYYNWLGSGYSYTEAYIGEEMITNECKTEYIITSESGNTKIGVTIEYK